MSGEILLATCVILAILIVFVGLLSVIYLVLKSSDQPGDEAYLMRTKSCPVAVILGSGGHTTEILSILKSLGNHYTPRYYIMANTDKMSEEKVQRLQSQSSSEYHVHKIPRSREVKQSWLTTVLSTIYATLYSFPLVFKLQPEIILCNGPGTCIPICIAGIVLKLFLRPVKIIYVESLCRVETLSLSGKILYRLADAMFVQWPQLHKKYPKTKYIGRIV